MFGIGAQELIINFGHSPFYLWSKRAARNRQKPGEKYPGI